MGRAEVRRDGAGRRDHPLADPYRRNGQTGAGLALRFPRVVGFIRDDKSPEDATMTKEIAECSRSKGGAVISATKQLKRERC